MRCHSFFAALALATAAIWMRQADAALGRDLIVGDGGAWVNTDGSVDVDDVIAVILTWGPCPPGPCPTDINADGTVDVDDVIAVILAWGACQ